MVRLLAIGILCLGCAGTAGAQVQINGYAKTLALRSTSVVDGSPFWLDISRFRLQAALDRAAWRVEAWADAEAQAGSYLDTAEAALSEAFRPDAFLDLETEVHSGSRHRILARVFRATASRYGTQTTVVIGRQRVAWGTGFVWNPTDLLNPLSPTALERDEKAAVDAVLIRRPVLGLTSVEAVFAPGPGFDRNRGAVRAAVHAGEFDVTFMAGRFAGRTAIGVDMAGYAGDAAVRAEAALMRDESWSLRAVANVDYTFSSRLYGFAELYYNGAGAWRRSDYRASPDAVTEGLGSLYAATSLSITVTPLTYVSVYLVQNLVDGSALVGPAMTVSLAENLDLTGSVYGFVGSESSEFGAASSVLFGQLQFYF